MPWVGALICPKCGSADISKHRKGDGKRMCKGCEWIGATKHFRKGGPKPKHKLDIREANQLPMTGGAIWKLPIRYDGDD